MLFYLSTGIFSISFYKNIIIGIIIILCVDVDVEIVMVSVESFHMVDLLCNLFSSNFEISIFYEMLVTNPFLIIAFSEET